MGSNKVLSKNEKDVCLRFVVGKNSLCNGIQQNGITGMFNYIKNEDLNSVPSLPLVPEIYGVLVVFWNQLESFWSCVEIVHPAGQTDGQHDLFPFILLVQKNKWSAK